MHFSPKTVPENVRNITYLAAEIANKCCWDESAQPIMIDHRSVVPDLKNWVAIIGNCNILGHPIFQERKIIEIY